VKIALIGTRGVPAAYGGFETAADELGTRLVKRGHEVTVYCRGPRGIGDYCGIQCVSLPAPRVKSLETLAHTARSILHARRQTFEAVVVFNAGNAPLLGLVKQPVVLHLDGLEWKRGKWGRIGRSYYKLCERIAAASRHELIADSEGIARYYETRYGAPSTVIAYGAPLRFSVAEDVVPLKTFNLRPDGYVLVVARLEPENNVHLALEAYARSSRQMPLVVVGDAPYRSRYLNDLKHTLMTTPGVRHLGRIDDQPLLDAVYANSRAYVHGHTVGGTNPSLLRAMGAGVPVLAYDTTFNREVADETARYFHSSEGLARLMDEAMAGALSELGERARERVTDRYDWDVVTDAYETLLERCSGANVA